MLLLDEFELKFIIVIDEDLFIFVVSLLEDLADFRLLLYETRLFVDSDDLRFFCIFNLN